MMKIISPTTIAVVVYCILVMYFVCTLNDFSITYEGYNPLKLTASFQLPFP